MERKKQILSTLLLNIFVCTALCLTAQLLTIAQGNLEHFVLPMFFLNFAIAYPVATVVGLFVPAPRFALWVCKLTKVKPGPAFGIVFTLAINVIFTLILGSVMTLFNVVILGGQGFGALIIGIISSFVPMWLASSLVSGIVQQPIEKLIDRILK